MTRSPAENQHGMLSGKCLAPKNPTPGVTTEFCVYERGHKSDHSWQHTREERQRHLMIERPNR